MMLNIGNTNPGLVSNLPDTERRLIFQNTQYYFFGASSLVVSFLLPSASLKERRSKLLIKSFTPLYPHADMDVL